MSSVLDELRNAIRDSGQSLGQIAEGSGVDTSQLSRLMTRQRELGVASAERVAAHLGYSITLRRVGRARKAK